MATSERITYIGLISAHNIEYSLYLGIRNRGVEALSGVFDSHLLSIDGVHSLSLVHDLTIH